MKELGENDKGGEGIYLRVHFVAGEGVEEREPSCTVGRNVN